VADSTDGPGPSNCVNPTHLGGSGGNQIGVMISGATINGEGNTIANNNGPGVQGIAPSAGNTILGNAKVIRINVDSAGRATGVRTCCIAAVSESGVPS